MGSHSTIEPQDRPLSGDRAPEVAGILTLGIASYLNPLLILAEQLKVAGYRPVFISPSETAEEAVRLAGHRFYRLRPAICESVRQLETSLADGGSRWRIDRIGLRRVIQRARNESYRDGHGLQQFLDCERPRVVLVMAEMHEYIVYLAATGTPLVLTDTHLASRRRPGLPPPEARHVPSENLLSRRYSSLLWQVLTMRRRLGRVRRRLVLGGAERFAALRDLARSLGIDPDINFDMKQWHFVDYPGLPLLRLATPALDFHGGPEPDVAYTGALVGQNTPLQGRTGIEDSWRSFIETQAVRGRPLVFCSLGSFISNAAFLRRVIAASEDSAWALLLTTGPNCKPGDLGDLPDHVAAYAWVPQFEVLGHAAAMVCAGGNATINECITRGVPMLAYPMDRMDQRGMAARVVYHGMGLCGDLKRDRPASIRKRIQQLLGDGRFADSTMGMRQRFLAYAGSDAARNALEEAIGESQIATSALR